MSATPEGAAPRRPALSTADRQGMSGLALALQVRVFLLLWGQLCLIALVLSLLLQR